MKDHTEELDSFAIDSQPVWELVGKVRPDTDFACFVTEAETRFGLLASSSCLEGACDRFRAVALVGHAAACGSHRLTMVLSATLLPSPGAFTCVAATPGSSEGSTSPTHRTVGAETNERRPVVQEHSDCKSATNGSLSDLGAESTGWDPTEEMEVSEQDGSIGG